MPSMHKRSYRAFNSGVAGGFPAHKKFRPDPFPFAPEPRSPGGNPPQRARRVLRPSNALPRTASSSSDHLKRRCVAMEASRSPKRRCLQGSHNMQGSHSLQASHSPKRRCLQASHSPSSWPPSSDESDSAAMQDASEHQLALVPYRGPCSRAPYHRVLPHKMNTTLASPPPVLLPYHHLMGGAPPVSERRLVLYKEPSLYGNQEDSDDSNLLYDSQTCTVELLEDEADSDLDTSMSDE